MTHINAIRSRCLTQRGALLLASVMLIVTPVQAERGAQTTSPFVELLGAWSGTGSVSMATGSSERIRCQAAYASGDDPNNLRAVLRCASDSYKFELASDVTLSGSSITGAWKETSRNVTGPISGTAQPGDLKANINMPGFTADLNIKTQGNRQVVSLRSEGTELTGISMTLGRK